LGFEVQKSSPSENGRSWLILRLLSEYGIRLLRRPEDSGLLSMTELLI